MVATDSEDVEPVLANMQDAIENAACLSLTYSVRDSSVNGMDIHKGDQIGFLGKELCACAATVEACLKQLLLQVEDLEDKEIATVMYGNDTTEEDRETLRSLIEELCPEAELVEYDCAQELYSLLITLE
jgi:dihydroxyacetone kinase-like predicted kinase